MIRISIIIPAHNVSSYISACLESVQMQDLHDYEVIIVDDASTDNTREIVQSWIDRDERITLVSLAVNCGPGKTRNEGLAYARGEYIMFLDADDTIAKGILAKLYQQASNQEAEMMAIGYVRQFEFDAPDFNHPVLPGIANNKEEILRDLLTLRKNLMPAPWAFFFSRKFINDHQLVFPEEIYFEDVCFVFMAMFHAKRVATLPEPLYIYRVRRQSITHSEHVSKKKIHDYYQSNDTIASFMKKQNIYRHFQNEFAIRYLSYSLYTSYLDYFRLSTIAKDKELRQFMQMKRNDALFTKDNIMLVRVLAKKLDDTELRMKRFYSYVYKILFLIKYGYWALSPVMRLYYAILRSRKSSV